MSLLDTASLIVTPNGYKEGKLYSVIPSDGSGDMSVTRATTATRVNSAGLVELVPYNLLSYSQTFSNVIWVKNEATISSNIATAPNGTNTASKLVENTANDSHHIYQNAIANGVNTFSFYAKKGERTFVYAYADSVGQGKCFNLTSGTLGVNIIAAPLNATIENVGNDWFRCTITLSIASASALRIGLCSADGTFSYLGNGTSGAFIWGAQLVEGSTAKDYQRTETRLNIPRLDYSNGSCPSLLVEPQRTNAVTYSEFFSTANGYNYQNASQSGSFIVSPSGLLAYGITSTTAGFNFYRYYKTLGGRTGVNTTTIFAKKGTSRYLGLGVNQNGSTGNNNVVVFDLQDGVIASNIYGLTASIEDFGNGWYRLVHTFDYGTGGTYADICVHNTGTGAYSSIAFQTYNTPSSPTTIYVWGLQMEVGNYATSYIPTTSASVTRNADVISKTGISSLIGQTEGTIFMDFTLLPNNANSAYLFSVSDGSTNNLIRTEIYVDSPSIYQFRTGIVTLGVPQGDAFTNITQPNNKMAISYKLNEVKIFLNGVLVATDTSVTIPATSQVHIGNRNNTDLFIGSYYKSFVLFPTALTNTQLAQLTTI